MSTAFVKRHICDRDHGDQKLARPWHCRKITPSQSISYNNFIFTKLSLVNKLPRHRRKHIVCVKLTCNNCKCTFTTNIWQNICRRKQAKNCSGCRTDIST